MTSESHYGETAERRVRRGRGRRKNQPISWWKCLLLTIELVRPTSNFLDPTMQQAVATKPPTLVAGLKWAW